MNNLIDWTDEDLKLTYPLTKKHFKGAIAFLVSENRAVTLQTLKQTLPELLYTHGNYFYENAWYQNHHDQVEELFQKLFPENEQSELRQFLFFGMPYDFGLGVLLLFAAILAPLIIFEVLPLFSIFPYFGIAWVYGAVKARSNPKFFTKQIEFMPKPLKKIFEHQRKSLKKNLGA